MLIRLLCLFLLSTSVQAMHPLERHMGSADYVRDREIGANVVKHLPAFWGLTSTEHPVSDYRRPYDQPAAIEAAQIWIDRLAGFCGPTLERYAQLLASVDTNQPAQLELHNRFSEDFDYTSVRSRCSTAIDQTQRLLTEASQLNRYAERALNGYAEDAQSALDSRVAARKRLYDSSSSVYASRALRRHELVGLLALGRVLGADDAALRRWQQGLVNADDIQQAAIMKHAAALADHFSEPTDLYQESDREQLLAAIATTWSAQSQPPIGEWVLADNALRDSTRISGAAQGESYAAIALYGLRVQPDAIEIHYGWYERTGDGSERVVLSPQLVLPRKREANAAVDAPQSTVSEQTDGAAPYPQSAAELGSGFGPLAWLYTTLMLLSGSMLLVRAVTRAGNAKNPIAQVLSASPAWLGVSLGVVAVLVGSHSLLSFSPLQFLFGAAGLLVAIHLLRSAWPEHLDSARLPALVRQLCIAIGALPGLPVGASAIAVAVLFAIG